MVMKYFKDGSGIVHGFDTALATDVALMSELTAEWTDISDAWPVAVTITAAQAFAALQQQAAAALSESDRTILRCYENAVTVPAVWATYRAALRAIVNGTDATATALPARPAYPTGT